MLKTRSVLTAFLLTMALSTARGQDYSLEVIDAAPAADDVSAKLLAHFADTGMRIKRGSSRTICELWFCRQCAVEPDFAATDERLYPFSPGQLIGLLHFARKGSDFRDQTIGSGWYTLRFGLQPIDGNHVGTSPTRDFLVLVPAEQDEPEKQWDVKELQKASAQAAGSSHPAMMCLQQATAGAQAAIRHDETHDWWILHTVGQGIAGEKALKIPIDVVVVGHAAE